MDIKNLLLKIWLMKALCSSLWQSKYHSGPDSSCWWRCACCNVQWEKSVTLDGLLYKKYCDKVATSLTQVDPKVLPFTSAAVMFYSRQVFLQINCWIDPQFDLRVEEWGLVQKDTGMHGYATSPCRAFRGVDDWVAFDFISPPAFDFLPHNASRRVTKSMIFFSTKQ